MKTWDDDGKRLRREYVLASFAQAVAVINDIAALAEAADHHPDLHLTGYKRLVVELTTHSAGGKVTQKDRELAAKIESAVIGRTEASPKSTSKR
jgi:4a-hydroxytetrahydrobiopterin dehydratase